MKALVLKRVGAIEGSPLKLSELPVPRPAKDEILIKVKACGICHTDLHIIEGELTKGKIPIIPGHQIVGTVESLGSSLSPDISGQAGVKDFHKGDLVGVPWLYETCGAAAESRPKRGGKCEFCRGGRENLCSDARFTGYSVNGGYAPYLWYGTPY